MSGYKADYWINKLHLQQHIEGGWYSEIYRSDLILNKNHLPQVYSGDRSACTHIYFLLEKKGFSAFHRIQSDELWHFYTGDALIVYEIDENGQLHQHLLGNDPEKRQSLFCVIKRGNWFASRVADGGEFGLAGCTVAPGFDYKDFELAEGKKLEEFFPQHRELISQLSY